MKIKLILGAMLLSISTASAQVPQAWISGAQSEWQKLNASEKNCIERNLPWWAQHKHVNEYIQNGFGPDFIDITTARKAGNCFQGYHMVTNPNRKVESPDMPVIGYKASPVQPDYNAMSEEDQDTFETALYLMIGLIIGVYMLPGLIAIMRGHPSWAGIFVFNLLLGWTFLFWVAALVWSLSAKSQHVTIGRKRLTMDRDEFLRRMKD